MTSKNIWQDLKIPEEWKKDLDKNPHLNIPGSTLSGLYVATMDKGEAKIWLLDEYKKELVAERELAVWALCSHNGKLYDAGFYHKVFDTLADKEGKNPIAERSEHIMSLCVHNGKLYDAGYYNMIFDTLNDKEGNNPVLKCDDSFTALVSHDGELYDAVYDDDKIFKSFDRDYPIANRENGISALCSHNGRLYDASSNGQVFDTLRDREEGKNPIIEMYDIHDLCNHSGRLLGAGLESKIFDIFKNELIYELGNGLITAMCSHINKK